jgi:type I restriction enzyme S subunit
LGNLITVNPESIRNGYPFDEIEYIDISSVGTGTLQGTQRLQIVDAPSRAKRIVRNGDTLLATVRPNLRSFWFSRNAQENAIASTGFAVLRAGKEIDERFLYFTVTNQQFTDYLTANAKGAAYPAVDTDTIKRAEIFLPPLPTQRKIAAILSAYDDLIENNLRRIKILEEMAQSLYREWFVKFRFPGHQLARLTDSSLGRIPEGWEVVRFRDLLESSLGGDWGLDEPSDKENVPVFIIRGTDFADIVNGSSLRTPKRFIGPSSQAKRQLMAGDLLIENSINAKSRCVGTTLLITDGVLQRLRDRVIAASFCKVYRFKRPSLATLAHLHMRHLYEEGRMAFYQNVAANGIGNFQSQRFLESEHLVFPSDPEKRQEMLASLKDLTSSTFADQVFDLRRTRDLLLPRLISGEVDVAELDIAVPEKASA